MTWLARAAVKIVAGGIGRDRAGGGGDARAAATQAMASSNF